MAVDDDRGMLTLLRRLLRLEGYRVATARDGRLALALLDECRPDLILLDIMMPGLDGFQVLDLLRQCSDVPVIMLTAKCEAEYVHQAMVAGADDYVRKPFSTGELIARIRAKLRRAS